MSEPAVIWCVEDDTDIRDVEVFAMRSSGYEVRAFSDGAECWEALAEELPDLVLLDIMMPNMDGIELLKRMKASPRLDQIPVVMATAKGTEFDKIQGLELGADYYVTKPFGVMELVACIKAVLRRLAPRDSSLTCGGLELNHAKRTVIAGAEHISLTFKEFELLTYLMENQGIVLSRDQIFARVWGMEYLGESRTVDMHVRTLRQKLGDYAELVSTVRNVGYVMKDPR